MKRVEDPRLIKGIATYTDDIRLAGLLHASILRSPHAHARITSIDTSRAAALPGVLAVITSADFPESGGVAHLGEGGDVNLRHMSSNIMARDKALYCGHAIAAVAATSPHVAAE